MTILNIFVLAASLAGIAVSSFFLIKINNAAKNRMIIIKAIFLFRLSCICKCDNSRMKDVAFEDMEDFGETVYRLTDWGYKRILPKEKYELLAPYIDRIRRIEKDGKHNA